MVQVHLKIQRYNSTYNTWNGNKFLENNSNIYVAMEEMCKSDHDVSWNKSFNGTSN